MKNIFTEKKILVRSLILASFVIAFIFSASVASAAAFTSGPNNAGSATDSNSTGSISWTAPGNITTVGSPYATALLGAGDISHYIKGTNYGFNIPSNATVDGIAVEIRRNSSSNNLGFGVQDNIVRMIKNGTILGNNKAVTGTTWGTATTSVNYGGVSDLWGTTWTPADINSSNFGLAFSILNTSPALNRTATLDYIKVTVYYTISTPTITLSSSVSTSTPTNQDITINATTTGTGVLNASSYLFTANGTFVFVASNAGGTTTATATISNIDKVAPTLSTHADITGIEATSNLGATVTYTNATSTDNVDPSPVVTCVAPSGSTFAIGTTAVICNAHDNAGNNATSTTFNITVVDTTAPVISVTGADPVTVQAGTTYVDAGAIAIDNAGNFTASSTSNVDTNTLGSYTVTYSATDAYGNSATSTTRTVNVVDTTAPSAPSATAPINNSIYRTASLTKLDWSDVSDFSSPVTYGYQLSTSATTNPNGSFSFPMMTGNTLTSSEASTTIATEGVYYYIARAVDALGNTGAWMTPVSFRIDNTAPVITVTGSSTVTVEGGSVYTDAGATALDTVDGSFAATASGTVDTSVVGTYTITYSAQDIAGNVAATATRTVIVVDTTATLIHVTCTYPVTLECTASASSYVDAGATATDNVAAPVTVISTGTVNTHVVGSYTITYTATDLAGNSAATTTRTVNVVDTTAPVIHITGANPIIFTINNPYTELGATAADLVDGAITATSSGTVDTATLGSYTVTYTATDLAGNSASSTRTVMVIPPDTTAPVITLLGTTPVTVEGGSTYTDAGATASDNVNGNMTSAIVTVNPVNTHVVAPYTVTYNVTDGAGNPATEVTRTVNVVDTTAPVITLVGGDMSLHTGDTFSEPGSIVTDNIDATSTATVTGSVNTSATSTTVLVYDAVDANGNHAIPVTRTVTVVDVSVPIITLLGNSSVNLEVGTTYTDAGATSTDDVDGDITANIVVGGTVNNVVLGDYTLTYNVSDSSLNAATQVTRTVHVVDTTAPVVTLNGSSTVNLLIGDTYTEDGATASDNYDVAAPSVSITGTVDINTAGTYTLTYSATDTSGNTGTTTRTVVVSAVPDTVAPIITLLGANPMSVTVGGIFTDPGATALDNIDATTTVSVSGSVNTAVVGVYTLSYNAHDVAGNNAATSTRTVNVVAAENTGGSTGGGSTGGSTAGGGGNVLPNNGSTGGSGTSTPSRSGTVLGAETFQFTKNLRLGMRNDDVMELQKRLVAEGFLKVTPTGYFGKATFAAVKAYQAAHSVKPVSGFVGPLTRAELNK